MTAGGVLVFLGSLVYLYIVYQAVTAGGTSSWLGGYAQLWTPLVAAVAVFSSIALFFLSITSLAGSTGGATTSEWRWKYIMWSSITLLIWTAGGQWFLWAVVGLVLTYFGNRWATM